MHSEISTTKRPAITCRYNIWGPSRWLKKRMSSICSMLKTLDARFPADFSVSAEYRSNFAHAALHRQCECKILKTRLETNKQNSLVCMKCAGILRSTTCACNIKHVNKIMFTKKLMPTNDLFVSICNFIMVRFRQRKNCRRKMNSIKSKWFDRIYGKLWWKISTCFIPQILCLKKP